MKARVVQNILSVAVAALSVSLPACRFGVPVSGGSPVMFSDSLAFVVLSIIPFILAVLSICNTSRPGVKLRIDIACAVILLCFQIWIAVWLFRFRDAYAFALPAVFPLVALILEVIAARYAVGELSLFAAAEIKSVMDTARKRTNDKPKHSKDDLH